MPICNKNGIARILRLNSKKGTNAPPLLSKNTPLGNPEYLRSDGTYSFYQGGDGGGDDNGGKIKDDTMVVGDWTTGPEGDLPDNIAKSNTHISDMPQYNAYSPNSGPTESSVGDDSDDDSTDTSSNSHVCTAAFHNGLINSFDLDTLFIKAANISIFGWKKEAIPIIHTKKSFITRIFKSIFG